MMHKTRGARATVGAALAVIEAALGKVTSQE